MFLRCGRGRTTNPVGSVGSAERLVLGGNDLEYLAESFSADISGQGSSKRGSFSSRSSGGNRLRESRPDSSIQFGQRSSRGWRFSQQTLSFGSNCFFYQRLQFWAGARVLCYLCNRYQWTLSGWHVFSLWAVETF